MAIAPGRGTKREGKLGMRRDTKWKVAAYRAKRHPATSPPVGNSAWRFEGRPARGGGGGRFRRGRAENGSMSMSTIQG